MKPLLKVLLLSLGIIGVYHLIHYGTARSDLGLELSHCVEPNSKKQTISALMIGNSLMNGVQPKLGILLQCAGYTSKIEINIPGGKKLYEHDSLPSTTNLIALGFDIVMLQEQSVLVADNL